MKTNPLRLPFYIYVYLYMYTQTSAGINRRLKPPKKNAKSFTTTLSKARALKKYNVVS